jgi:hypothetical protein
LLNSIETSRPYLATRFVLLDELLDVFFAAAVAPSHVALPNAENPPQGEHAYRSYFDADKQPLRSLSSRNSEPDLKLVDRPRLA